MAGKNEQFITVKILGSAAARFERQICESKNYEAKDFGLPVS